MCSRVCVCAQSVVSNSLRPHGLTIAHQAPLSMGFYRQQNWSRLPKLPITNCKFIHFKKYLTGPVWPEAWGTWPEATVTSGQRARAVAQRREYAQCVSGRARPPVWGERQPGGCSEAAAPRGHSLSFLACRKDHRAGCSQKPLPALTLHYWEGSGVYPTWNSLSRRKWGSNKAWHLQHLCRVCPDRGKCYQNCLWFS